MRLTSGQASGHADIWSDVPQDIWWPSVIPYQVIAVENLILSSFVDTTKLKSYLNSYHPMQKNKKSSGHGKIIDSPA